VSDPFSTVTAELPRDRWGRPLITPPEGGDPVAYTRVTTFVKCLDDTFHLEKWKMRMVALGMSSRRDLVLATIALKDPEAQHDKRTLNQIADNAIEAAKGTARATTGTALHSFSEVIDKGEELPAHVPEEYVADLDVYREIVRYLGEPLAMEGFCVVDALRTGGSYDRVWRFTAAGLDLFEERTGRRMSYPTGEEVKPGDAIIGDLKTGRSIDFGIGAITMQLATYANAEDYDHTLGSRTPVPVTRKDWGVVVHLPAGTGQAQLVWVDLAAGWETVTEVAPRVHAWRKRKDLSYPFLSSTSSAPRPLSLVEQLAATKTEAELRALWKANALVWTPGLTSLAKERVAAFKAAS